VAIAPPSPETLLRWQRELVRGKWAAYPETANERAASAVWPPSSRLAGGQLLAAY